MTVYVDTAADWGGKFKNCSHLFADDVEELHAFAARIGMKRSWFQPHVWHPHYDVFAGMRTKAVQAGAIEVDYKFTCRWSWLKMADLAEQRGDTEKARELRERAEVVR